MHTFSNILVKNCIKQKLIEVATPQQNGLSEREKDLIFRRARALLHKAQLSKAFWEYAVRWQALLLNRAPLRMSH